MIKASLPQIRTIQMLRKKLKLDNGEYYGILDSYGAAHCNELPFESAKQLIDSLKKTAISCGVWEEKKGARKYDNLKNREPNMATPSQLRLVEGLWSDVSYAPPDQRITALRRFLFTIVKVSDPRFLTMVMVRKVVKALETMKKKKLNEPGPQSAAQAS